MSDQTLIIFDCDGVLVDSEIISVKVDQIVLADLGWIISEEEIIRRFVGRSHAYFVQVVEEHLGLKLSDDWEDAYQHLYRQELAANLNLVDGIADALEIIPYPSCVASNGSHSKMEFTLTRAGLWSRFRGRIFSASDVAHGKPEPDLFLHAAQALGFEPSDCVVIEDSWAGVQAALAAKMRVVAYAGGITTRERLQGEGVKIIEHMSQLPGAIEALINQ